MAAWSSREIPGGYLIALDARTGKVFWRFQTGAGIKAQPIGYFPRGKQFIAIAAGANLLAFKVALEGVV